MKKRNIIISVCLVAVMLVTMIVPAFAAWGVGEDDCQCGKAPVIQVRGIGETLYVNGEEVFSTDKIVEGILPVLPQLATFLTDTSNVDLFIDAAKQAVENDVHVLGVSSLAAGHKTLVPQVIEELKKLGREDIIVIAGGVIPAQDYDYLYQAGVAAIFGPGTPVATSVIKMLEILLDEE